MKKILFTMLAACSITLFVNAQSAQYVTKMKEGIALMDSAKSTQDYKNVKAFFERIANAEKTQWLPFYYAALANTTIGWMDSKVDKDALSNETIGLLDKAEAISKNSEIYCVKQMAYTQQMIVDPMTRFMTYGMKASQALATAKQLDPTNPRPYYLDGVGLKDTPAQFGGGCDKAKPILQKAMDLFNSFKLASDISPNWGKENTQETLAACSK